MRWPIYLLGFIMLLLGGAIVINPEVMRRIIDFIDGIKLRLYALGAVRLAVGILLILSAENSRLYGFILGLGVLIALAGVACFVVPTDKLARLIAWYRERSLITYRVMGIGLLVLSSALLFAC